ncbi:MAG: hypothetical protein H6R40_840, partial [Gemmatimonadetes bacterium]|nr:hypothetical protein [Gemmatimonadota bacterium]
MKPMTRCGFGLLAGALLALG